MSKTIKQHFVPQFYLKNWATNNVLWTYDKRSTKSQNKRTDKIMYRKFFYDYPKISEENKKAFLDSIESEDERKFAESLVNEQFFEKYFGEVENLTAKRFKKLERSIHSEYVRILQKHNPFQLCNSEFIDQKMKYDISNFLSLQYIRTEYMRNTFASMMTKIYQKTTDMYVANSNDETLKALKPKVELKDEAIKVQHLSSMLKMFGEFEKYFFNYHWGVFINTTNINFLTSDVPLSMTAPKESIHPFGGVGFATPKVEIYYPLTPKIMLFFLEPFSMSKENSIELDIVQNKTTIFFMTEEYVKRMNDMIYDYANQYVVSTVNNFDEYENK